MKKYIVEDLIESAEKVMTEKEILELTHDYYEEMEWEWDPNDQIPKPKTIDECVKYLDIYGFRIMKA